MFKKAILFLHRWLGLITGAVVLILSITGAIFVFQKEFTHWLRHDVMYVEAETQRLSVEEMYGLTADALEVDRLSYGLTTYKDPGRSWTAFSFTRPDEPSWTYFGSIEEYKTAYLNPYSGEVLTIIDEEKDFFQIVKGIHWSLLLSTPIGQPIVAWSTVIFLVLLITGMVLWWPKKWNKNGRKRSFNISWKSKWRRLNYDLHNVLGFYSLILAFVIGFTGLYWAFPMVQKTLHFIGTGEYSMPQTEQEVVQSVVGDSSVDSPLEAAYRNAWDRFPDADNISFIRPAGTTGVIRAIVRGDDKTYYEKSEMAFDRYTGEIVHVDDYDEKNRGEKLIAMNYDIHVGAIGGIPGKILAFLLCIVSGSLPVTGFIMWWDKRKRNGK
ncbi:PepSY-associated TM helix domain-containing protein [Rhodohalobacter halophilus]|uniref:PepSY-associated TM helix domain-containing protein n=1 Tax=Rhodohalobacter halophilus TaxID=1812810 RepID=UPI00083F8285|nr:PepSY-associated TM helix domain-containing protein [Rhodohalobacter halophilus]